MYYVTLFYGSRIEYLPVADEIIEYRPDDPEWKVLLDGVDVADVPLVHTILVIRHGDEEQIVFLMRIDGLHREDFRIERAR